MIYKHDNGDFTVSAPQISSTVLGIAASFAIGKEGGAGIAIGASIARNLISTDVDDDGELDAPSQITSANRSQVRARLINSSVNVTGGGLNVLANAQQSIDTYVGSFAVAVAGGTSEGVGFSAAGAGARATNGIAVDVAAGIHGSGVTGVHADMIKVAATDASSIEAVTGSMAVAVSFGKAGAVSIAVGVTIAENEVSNDVSASITSAADIKTYQSGAIDVTAGQFSSIDSTAFAVSVAVAVSKESLAAAVGVLFAQNNTNNTITANVSSSTLVTQGNINVSTTDRAEINADTLVLAIAVGMFGFGYSAGSAANFVYNDAKAWLRNSQLESTNGGIAVEATSTPSILNTSTTATVAFSLGPGLAIFESTSVIGGETTSYVKDSNLCKPSL